MASNRAKGYMDWNPRPETVQLIGQVQEVLGGSDEQLTARQVFYILVGQFGFEKTEQAYARLCEHLVKARRSQMIPFNAIRDDKTDEIGGDWGYWAPHEFWDELRESSRRYRRPRREGQEKRIELWCEARGMGPSLARVARKYGVEVFATGGFPGVTVTHAMAQRVEEHNEPTVFLHIGDYDPSGESIYDSMRDDTFAFVAGAIGIEEARRKFHPFRIGLTEDQVVEHQIETAPPKKSDGRSRRWEEEGRIDSAQLEAVPPELYREWVQEAIEDHTDLAQMQQVIAEGDAEREKISSGLERLFAEFDENDE